MNAFRLFLAVLALADARSGTARARSAAPASWPDSSHRRFLRILLDDTSANPPAVPPADPPADPPAVPPADSAGVIEGGISVERCIESDVLGIYSGSFVLSDVFKVEDTRVECCQLCVATSGCLSWDYCQLADGCTLPETLVKIQSPLQKEGGEVDIAVNGTQTGRNGATTLPYQACVLNARPVVAELAESKRFSGDGARFGFFSATVERRFLPYLSGFKASEGKNISTEYDFPCGYSPQKERCEVIGSIPEVSGICSSDPRCRGFVFNAVERLGVLKGGDGASLLTEDVFVDDPNSVVYALTAKGQEAQLGSQATPSTTTSSSSNLWIILISVLGGVAVLAIAAVTVTMIVLSRRGEALQKSAESYSWYVAALSDVEYEIDGSGERGQANEVATTEEPTDEVATTEEPTDDHHQQ